MREDFLVAAGIPVGGIPNDAEGEESDMGIGISVFLIAVGAIITFALNVSVSGINLASVGTILMVVGAIGLVWSLVVAGTAGRRGGGGVVEESPVVERRVVRDGF